MRSPSSRTTTRTDARPVPRVVYRTAATLDGRIATPDHSLAWLFAVGSREEPDHAAFLQTVGALVMGASTFAWVVREEDLVAHPDRWPGYFGDRPTFVFAHRELDVPAGADVRVVRGDVAAHAGAVRAAAGVRDVWLVGGGELAGQFHDAGLLDEVQVTIAPATLGDGAPLLPRVIGPDRMDLVDVARHDRFAHLVYAVRPPG